MEQSPPRSFLLHPTGKGHSALTWQLLSTKKRRWGLQTRALSALAKTLSPQHRILALLRGPIEVLAGLDQQG